MESGAKGCEVVVSGKLRGQRAKSMKFVDGLMIHSGEPTKTYVDTAVRHVYLRQGNNYFSHSFNSPKNNLEWVKNIGIIDQ
jgi:ribosomal protein S3